MIDVEDLKGLIPMLDLVEHYGGKAKGNASQRQVSVWCPFCSDITSENPGATINTDLDLFHCFICGVGGDIISIVMQEENLDFRGALEWLTTKFEVE